MLETKVPTAAELLDLENKAEAAVEARWRSRADGMAREMEATRISVQNLLADNIRLKSEVTRVEEEAERARDAEKAKYEKRVRTRYYDGFSFTRVYNPYCR